MLSIARVRCTIRPTLQSVEPLDSLGQHALDTRAGVDAAAVVAVVAARVVRYLERDPQDRGTRQ